MRGVIIAAVALLALSGCFGLAEGAADFGDTVTVRYVAVDADTGEVYSGPLTRVDVYDIRGEPHYDAQRLRTALDDNFDEVPAPASSWFADGSDAMHRSISVDRLENLLGNIRNTPGLADAGDGCGAGAGRSVTVNGEQHVFHGSMQDCLEEVADDAAAAAQSGNGTEVQDAADAAEQLAHPDGIYTLRALPVELVMDDLVKQHPGTLGASVRFEMGSGSSGLGFAFERAVVGHQVNDTLVHRDHDGKTRGFVDERTVDREQNRLDRTFTEQVGNLPQVTDSGEERPAQAGDELPTGVTGIVAHVVSVDDNTATLRFDFESGIPVNVGHGVEAEYRHDGEEIWLQLDPIEGEVFTVQENPLQPDPFGLEPGSYRTEGATASKIIYGFTPTQNTDLITQPLDIYAEVVDVERGVDEVPTGEYGKRTSPVMPHVHGREAAEETGDHDDHGDHAH